MRINECSVKRETPAVSKAVYLALLRYLKISKKVLIITTNVVSNATTNVTFS